MVGKRDYHGLPQKLVILPLKSSLEEEIMHFDSCALNYFVTKITGEYP